MASKRRPPNDSRRECLVYLMKYISPKSEPRSKPSSEHHVYRSATSAVFKKCMIQSVGERDYGAQETAHLLPLYRCTYNFVTDVTACDPEICQSTIDVYIWSRCYPKYYVPQLTSTYSITKDGEPVKRLMIYVSSLVAHTFSGELSV